MRTDAASNLTRIGMAGFSVWAFWEAYEARRKAEADPANRSAYDSAALGYAAMGGLVGALLVWGWKDPLRKKLT